VLGSNGSAQLVADTAHNIAVPLTCADSSGSSTAQSCTTSPTFTPAANDCIIYTTTTANTSTLTLNVNSSSAAAVQKWMGSAVASGDIPANHPQLACYDGTNWQVMTIGNAPAGGGGGSVVWIQTQNASSSATLNFASCFSGTYDEYLIEFHLRPANNGVAMLLRVGTGGGPTYDSGSNYKWVGFRNSSSGTAVAGGGSTSVGLDASGNVSNSANQAGINGWIRFYNPGGGSTYTRILAHTAMWDGSDYVSNEVSGAYQTTTAVTAFQFLAGSGNLADGTGRCYGITH
jgi:hypothetical protein